MAGPTVDFWQQRFERDELPWDRGAPSPQMQAWLADGTLAPGQQVLVPGCGSGHEVAALAAAGVAVTGLDYAPGAVARTRARLAALPGWDATRAQEAVRQADVLAFRPDTPVEAVYEQTCWCALHPDHWVDYGLQLHRWLAPGGRLCLLAMQAPRPGAAEGRIEGPPFHTDVHALRAALPASRWTWPAPPYPRVPHPAGWAELAIVLTRR